MSQGVVPLLCNWLTESVYLPPTSYHHCLVKDVLFMLEGVAKIPHHCGEVSQSLSLETLNSHLLSSEEVFTVAKLVSLFCLVFFLIVCPSSAEAASDAVRFA